MKNKTGKKDGSGALALAPVGLSLLAAHAQSLWLAAAAGVEKGRVFGSFF